MNQSILRSTWWRAPLLVVLACVLGGPTFGQPAFAVEAENAKINFLLSSLANLKGAQFVRNGAVFSASEAVAHLRFKWRAAGARVVTAREFIREVATKSSVSGVAYTIRFADGREVTSAEFLQKQLLGYENDHP